MRTFSVHRFPFTMRGPFSVYRNLVNGKLLVDNLLKNENCKLKIERRRRV